MTKAKPKLQPAAEVVPILNASCERLKKLLALCDAQIELLTKDLGILDAMKAKELQVLVRMVLNLQKDLAKTMAALHPDISVTPPSVDTKFEKLNLESLTEQQLHDLMNHYLRGADDGEKGEEVDISISLAPNPKQNADSKSPPPSASAATSSTIYLEHSSDTNLRKRKPYKYRFFNKASPN
jgi:hypothetical protein